MNYKDFYKDLLNEALSVSFNKDKNFTDEQKKQATEAVKQYIKSSYKYYTDKLNVIKHIITERFYNVIRPI